MAKIVLLDAGHGIDTAGKCSPVWKDGARLREYELNRDLVRRIIIKCFRAGIRAVELVPEDMDIPLSERCERANLWHEASGGECIVVSIHANAGGGSGFEVFTSIGKTSADAIASELIAQFEKDFPTLKVRKDFADGDADKEANFYILQHTKSPAILAENLFMDNEQDCRLLLDDSFRDKLAESYIRFLKKIV